MKTRQHGLTEALYEHIAEMRDQTIAFENLLASIKQLADIADRGNVSESEIQRATMLVYDRAERLKGVIDLAGLTELISQMIGQRPQLGHSRH